MYAITFLIRSRLRRGSRSTAMLRRFCVRCRGNKPWSTQRDGLAAAPPPPLSSHAIRTALSSLTSPFLWSTKYDGGALEAMVTCAACLSSWIQATQRNERAQGNQPRRCRIRTRGTQVCEHHTLLRKPNTLPRQPQRRRRRHEQHGARGLPPPTRVGETRLPIPAVGDPSPHTAPQQTHTNTHTSTRRPTHLRRAGEALSEPLGARLLPQGGGRGRHGVRSGAGRRRSSERNAAQA